MLKDAIYMTCSGSTERHAQLIISCCLAYSSITMLSRRRR